MGKDAKTQLLEAAAKLFAYKGFSSVSIRTIAKEAGVNSAMIAYYFASKEGLYQAVLKDQFAIVEKALAKAELKNSPEEKLLAYAQAVARIHLQRPYLVRFIHSEMLNPTASFEAGLKTPIERIYWFLHRTLAEGKACGQFAAHLNIPYAVIALAGMMNIYFIARPIARNFVSNAEQEAEGFVTEALKIYLNGVRQSGNA